MTGLRVMQAHLTADCPDRATCWAKDIHDAHGGTVMPESTDVTGIEMPRELLEALVISDDCWFDHHGGCQAHGYLSLDPGQECPQHELKRRLSAATGGPA